MTDNIALLGHVPQHVRLVQGILERQDGGQLGIMQVLDKRNNNIPAFLLVKVVSTNLGVDVFPLAVLTGDELTDYYTPVIREEEKGQVFVGNDETAVAVPVTPKATHGHYF